MALNRLAQKLAELGLVEKSPEAKVGTPSHVRLHSLAVRRPWNGCSLPSGGYPPRVPSRWRRYLFDPERHWRANVGRASASLVFLMGYLVGAI